MDITPELTSTITAQTPSPGYSQVGTSTWNAQRTVTVKWVHVEHRTLDAKNGNEVLAQDQIETNQLITVNDRIWLPGATTSDPTQARALISLSSNTDRTSGTTLYKASF